MLTGDKIETAINIGFSCALLDNKMELFKIISKTKENVKADIERIEKKMAKSK